MKQFVSALFSSHKCRVLTVLNQKQLGSLWFNNILTDCMLDADKLIITRNKLCAEDVIDLRLSRKNNVAMFPTDMTGITDAFNFMKDRAARPIEGEDTISEEGKLTWSSLEDDEDYAKEMTDFLNED